MKNQAIWTQSVRSFFCPGTDQDSTERQIGQIHTGERERDRQVTDGGNKSDSGAVSASDLWPLLTPFWHGCRILSEQLQLSGNQSDGQHLYWQTPNDERTDQICCRCILETETRLKDTLLYNQHALAPRHHEETADREAPSSSRSPRRQWFSVKRVTHCCMSLSAGSSAPAPQHFGPAGG